VEKRSIVKGFIQIRPKRKRMISTDDIVGLGVLGLTVGIAAGAMKLGKKMFDSAASKTKTKSLWW